MARAVSYLVGHELCTRAFLPPLSILFAGRPFVAIVTFLIWVPAVIFSGGLTHPMFILLAWIPIYQAREDRRLPRDGAATLTCAPVRALADRRAAPRPRFLGADRLGPRPGGAGSSCSGSRISTPRAARPVFEDGIRDDLALARADWPEPVLRQSEHLARYARRSTG